MSMIAQLNQAFREIENDNLVVQQMRASAATIREIRKSDRNGWLGHNKLWTAIVVVDEAVPYGEVDLSPDLPSQSWPNTYDQMQGTH